MSSSQSDRSFWLTLMLALVTHAAPLAAQNNGAAPAMNDKVPVSHFLDDLANSSASYLRFGPPFQFPCQAKTPWTWIVACPADPSEIPSIGIARYSGHAIGNVTSGGTAVYTAVGPYDVTWNFGRRIGTAHLQFDGKEYSGTLQLRGSVMLEGTFSAVNRAGTAVGNFVQAQGASSVTAPTGLTGRFVIQDTDSPYRASGVFGAERQ